PLSILPGRRYFHSRRHRYGRRRILALYFRYQISHVSLYIQETRVAFFGHIHVPLLFACQVRGCRPDIRIERLRDRNLRELPEHKFLINPGSVGQPRNADNRSCAMVYDSESGRVAPVTADYDIFATCKRILNAGLPEELAFRLIKGC
ncbi:MAG: metallophosphoesterase family protein, partial [Victivallales bacterium]|nr:metallophosphoesterase family protein [Victivallales bacterium]